MAIQKIVILICSAAGEKLLQQRLSEACTQLSPHQQALLVGFISNALHKQDERRSVRAWENIDLANEKSSGVVFLQKIVTEMEEKDFHYLQVSDFPVTIMQKGSFISNTNLTDET